MNKKYSLQDRRDFAATKNGECLSKKLVAVDKKDLWECVGDENGIRHQWLASFHKIKNGSWCPYCKKTVKHTIEECFEYAKSKNGECLSAKYIDNKTLLVWRCILDGTIWNACFHNIKNGNTWCPTCAINKSHLENLKYIIDDCHSFAKSKNGKCLSLIYIGAKNHINWECEKNHRWSASFDNVKNNNTWCPRCLQSKPQKEINDFIQRFGFTTIFNDRKLIAPFEIDIFIQEKNIGIEYCGLYWHGEKLNTITAKTKHLNKLKLCQEKGIQLITIFEDEWLLKQEQVKGYLKAILGKTENKIGARKCKTRLVNNKIAKQFHIDNNIQGSNNGKHLGLFFNDELIALSTFAKPSANRKNKIELVKYTVKINYSIQNGLNKLLKHYLIGNDNIKEVISYSDNRWSEGNIYKTLGFGLINTGGPSYFYFKNNDLHRYYFKKRKVLELFGGDADAETEWSIMSRNGYDRIWDCGNSKWALKLSN